MFVCVVEYAYVYAGDEYERITNVQEREIVCFLS